MNAQKFPVFVLLAIGLLGCPSGSSNTGVDAGASNGSCENSGDCRDAKGVCRAGICQANVSCLNQVDCGLGERCVENQCRFSGCVSDSDCPSGLCRKDTLSCAECRLAKDCPIERPVCNEESGRCLGCKEDTDCAAWGAPYCDSNIGQCLYCRFDTHCPNGLKCSTQGTCVGAQRGDPCSAATACDVGLMCVNLNGVSKCELPCNLYEPLCASNELCLKLVFASSQTLVYDNGIPQGVCHQPLPGLGILGASCTRSATGNSCQPNLECVPTSATENVCRGYCQPGSNQCPTGQVCHAFPGNAFGNTYGVCYPDTGYGNSCTNDATCRPGQACMPWNDPTALQSLSPRCVYAVGQAPTMAPCSQVTASDGGLLAPDAVCASGACRGDSRVQSGNVFCFGACATDADCEVGGRQGTCDEVFAWQAVSQSVQVKGCRPKCASNSDCGEWGGALVCRGREEGPLYVPKWVQTCGASVGAQAAGQTCTQNSDCASGLCALRDGVGARREGVCRVPCKTSLDCPQQSTPEGIQTCLSTALWLNEGPDLQAATMDDVVRVASVCSGSTCLGDANCSGGAKCVPDLNALALSGPRVMRCRSPGLGGVKTAGQVCATHEECVSGTCLDEAVDGGAGQKRCFQACDATNACAAGLNCQPDALKASLPNGATQRFAACVP